MLRVDPAARTLSRLESTTLSRSKILEREHLQKAIINSWDAFCAELGLPELYFVQQEVEPHDACRDRIDILALDADGSPHVFELKRHRDRLQLLQALSYAAMVSGWNKERYLALLTNRTDEDTQELRRLLENDGFELKAPNVVLLAESFDPEVILTARWLSEFQVSISAFAISAVDDASGTLLSIEQRFPLLGLEDVYVSRGRRAPPAAGSEGSWDEVAKALPYDFAAEAMAAFRKHKEGNAAARRFASIYSDSPLGRMRISFREHHIKIYTYDQSPDAEKELRSRLGEVVPFVPWGSDQTKNSGFTFQLETRAQLHQFLRAVGDR
jgi:hypothetical protein